MFYSALRMPGRSCRRLETFLGLDRRPRAREGSFRRVRNFDSRSYPALSTRPLRGLVATLPGASGLLAKGSALAWTQGEKLVWNGLEIPDLTLQPEGEKTLVSMGPYILIFPDKKYLNTRNLEDKGSLEQRNRLDCATANVTYRLCLGDGTLCENYAVSPNPPAEPQSGDLWVDTSTTPDTLKVYSGDTGMWGELTDTCVRLEAPGIGTGLSPEDGVTLTGASQPELNGALVLRQTGADWILLPGILRHSYVQTSGILEVSRLVPDMDFVTQCGNRLWGCKYGMVGGQVVNEIYGCALGDFKNWNRFQGLATDSYAASRGSEGPWTGAITHLGCPLFFKENAIEKVYPSSTGAHEIVTTNCRGVERGSEKSLTLVGELVYYKSPLDVCCYDGSLPQTVSQALGEVRGHGAVGGALGHRYYLSMEEEEGPSLLVYDTALGLWHGQENPGILAFATAGRELFALCGDGRLLAITGTTGQPEPAPEWHLETGPLYTSTGDASLTRLQLRLELEETGWLEVQARWDDGPWEPCGTLTGKHGTRQILRLLPHRCQSFALSLHGQGPCCLHTLELTIEPGTEDPWPQNP